MKLLDEKSDEMTPEIRLLVLRMMEAQLEILMAIYGSPERIRKMLEEKAE